MKYTNKDVLRAEMLNLEFNHKHESEGHRCGICWQKQCEHTFDVTTDPFLNMSEDVAVDELLYA